MQPRLDAMAPASHASDSTMTPFFSISALMSFMNGESLSRAALSWLRTSPGIKVALNSRTLPEA